MDEDFQEEEFSNIKNIFQSEEENGAEIKLFNKSRERSLSLNDFILENNSETQNIINQYILEFREEILNFKENKEKDIVEILKKFFNYKIQLLNDLNSSSFL